MASHSKRMKAAREKIDREKAYDTNAGLDLLKELSSVKFDESVDICVKLGVDARKSDQVVRGATVLPNGSGRDVKVAVFAQGPNAEAATKAGADVVGFDDLAEQVKAGNMDFDVVIATPDAMPVVGKLGQILGPRGLMPNPKVGTVTKDVEAAVKNAKGGQVRYRTDKGGLIHCTIGKVSFETKKLLENLQAVLADLRKLKPSSAKGIYIRKIAISTTMGAGLMIDQSSLED